MKKIWILNHYAILPQHGGGTRHFDFAEELTKRGYKVTIFASSFNHFTKKEINKSGQLFTCNNYNGVDFIWLRTTPQYDGNGIKRLINMFSYFINILRIYRSFEKPDVVIGSSVHLFACLAAYFISKKTNAKFITEIRDLWPQTLIDMGAISRNHPLAIVFRIIERLVYRKSEKIVTLLPGAYKYICRFGVKEEKICYIPNGLNIKRYKEATANLDNEIDMSLKELLQEYFCCVYLGSHGIANNLDTIVKAGVSIKQNGYNKIKLVLIGDGTEKINLIQYCKSNNIDNVEFFGQVKKELIPKILTYSKLNLVAMKDIMLYQYGISLNKMFEYLYSGKPIVFAGNVYNDVVKEAGAGLSVPAEDAGAFAKAIIDLYNMSESERDIMGQNGKAYIENYHNIPCLADRLEELFN